MERVTGKVGVIMAIEKDIQKTTEERLGLLGLDRAALAEDVYDRLLQKVKEMNAKLQEIFKQPRFDTEEGCRTVLNATYELAGGRKGFFLKREKAEELLYKNPPQNVMRELGCKNVKELLGKEDLWAIFAALRFAEDMKWLNSVFFRPYEDVIPDDFEEREITAHVLEKKWTQIGKRYVGHKLHNVSHLKELGIIFVLPYEEHKEGETIQIFSLIMHYFHEVDFYARLFRNFAKGNNFGKDIISSLRGDVGGLPMADHEQVPWRIVQRYLAKDDANDARLFEPHVNPEAMHWRKAEQDLVKFGEQHEEIDLEFWNKLWSVAGFFSKELVSFDLEDNAMMLAHRAEGKAIALSYHQQEALWNRLFASYVGGPDKLEEYFVRNMDKGVVSF